MLLHCTGLTVWHCVTMGMHSEKCIVRQFVTVPASQSAQTQMAKPTTHLGYLVYHCCTSVSSFTKPLSCSTRLYPRPPVRKVKDCEFCRQRTWVSMTIIKFGSEFQVNGTTRYLHLPPDSSALPLSIIVWVVLHGEHNEIPTVRSCLSQAFQWTHGIFQQ